NRSRSIYTLHAAKGGRHASNSRVQRAFVCSARGRIVRLGGFIGVIHRDGERRHGGQRLAHLSGGQRRFAEGRTGGQQLRRNGRGPGLSGQRRSVRAGQLERSRASERHRPVRQQLSLARTGFVLEGRGGPSGALLQTRGQHHRQRDACRRRQFEAS